MKLKLTTLLILFSCLSGFAQSAESSIKVSDDIELIKLSENAFVHVSYFDTEVFGRVSANGLLLIDQGKAFLFDSPWDDSQTETLLHFVKDSLLAQVIGFIPNHFHEDCMGGLAYLNTQGVKSYANQMTIDLAKEKGLPIPEQGFNDSLSLKLNDMEIACYYLGAGHATDNIVVWIPSEKILFGGCLVKDMNSKGLGNLSDANVAEWPVTIGKVIAKFPSAEIVIPGHGKVGGKELLHHTYELLK